MITMHASSRQTDGQTDERLDEHDGNSVTIRSNASIAR